MGLGNEQELVNSFVCGLGAAQSPWGTVQVATEFDYQRGRTDIVAYTSNEVVIAIEAKLDSSGSFGIITSTLSGYGNRQVQTALRVAF